MTPIAIVVAAAAFLILWALFNPLQGKAEKSTRSRSARAQDNMTEGAVILLLALALAWVAFGVKP